VALVAGLWRERRALARELPSLVWFAAVGTAVWSSSTAIQRGAGVAAAIAFAARFWMERTASAAPGTGRSGARTAFAYLALALATTAVFQFRDLGGYAGSIFVWEGGSIDGFGNAFRAGESASDFARRQLIWNDGVLSAGDASLLYGAPTYWLLKTAGFTTWNLRAVAALCALLAVLVSFFVARRFFGPLAGAGTALAMASSVSVQFHGRYGVAMSATFLAVLLALSCVWGFLDGEGEADASSPSGPRPSALRKVGSGALAAGSLYLATLQYATGRIVALLLFGFASAYSVLRRDRLRRHRMLGLLSFLLVAGAVWHVQDRHGARRALLTVRGEQFFSLADHPATYREELRRQPETITWRDKLDLLRAIVGRTGPQYGALMAPAPADLAPAAAMTSHGRIVHPYYAPLFAFLLLGLGVSLTRLSFWPHACLLLCALGTSAALLMTTGVDAHRIAILSIPCALWIGLGVRESARTLARLRVPPALQHAVALLLGAGCALHLAEQLYFARPPAPERARFVLAETADVEGPIILGAAWDSLEGGWLLLQLLERARTSVGADVSLLDPRLRHAIQDNRSAPGEVRRELIALIRRATLVLVPANQFETFAGELRANGIEVEERGGEQFRFLRIDRQR
jgi:hypothetical protein